VEDPPDVVDLQIGPREPLDKPVPSLVRTSQRAHPVVLEATLSEQVLLLRISQLEAGVFAHRLVQSVAGAAPVVLLDDQRFVDQRGQHGEHVGCRQAIGGAH
jgi:hypothetical protein